MLTPNKQIRVSLKSMIAMYEVKKNQSHTTNKKPNMYKDINKDNQYFGLSNRPSSSKQPRDSILALLINSHGVQEK